MEPALFLSVFVVATCGLVYELVAGTLASYLLGDSVTQFSTIIGAYLSAMGVGSYLSKYIKSKLIESFVRIELLLGLFGGFSATGLFILFEYAAPFRVALYSIVFLIGVLVGLEIPLLMRILRERIEFSELVSKVLSFDYLGALVASILFPLVFVPHLGLARTALFFGILNNAIALWMLSIFGKGMTGRRTLLSTALVTLILLFGGFIFADKAVESAETAFYADPVIYAKSTHYQRIVLTRQRDDTRLFLNGALQFSSRDEYRYHEALVHPGLGSIRAPKRVLILGGGDGMAAREVLKYPSVDEIVLVDLDPAMTVLFSSSPLVVGLNGGSLKSPKLKVYNEDAFEWLKAHSNERFDFVIIDFPDPTNLSLGKLYTNTFYHVLSGVMGDEGIGVVQSTSPLFARKSFWCVFNTLSATGFKTRAYHTYVGSFGEWGYVLFGKALPQLLHQYPQNLRYITPQVTEELFHFPPDMQWIETDINRLNNQILVHYYEAEWANFVA